MIFAWNSPLFLELWSLKRPSHHTKVKYRWRSFLISLFVLVPKIMVSPKIWEKKHNFNNCFILSVEGKVTWPNPTGKITIVSSARAFQFVVCALKWTCCFMHGQKASWTYPPQVFTSVHLFSKIIRTRFTISSPFFYNNWVKIHCPEIKVWWRFTKLINLFFLGKDSRSNKQNDKTVKRLFVQDSPCFILYKVKIHHVEKWISEDLPIPK